ncbi:hypothetical protein FACS1894169_00930 [Bacteroidia bacterium]|nr:hypothetical protein FACS1894169_00930 [Bacteroidia bacterium]
MRAIICDKCGVMWKNEIPVDNKINIRTIIIGYENDEYRYDVDKISYDLCEKCRNDLFNFLNNNEKECI